MVLGHGGDLCRRRLLGTELGVAGFVIVTNLFLRPLVQRLNKRALMSPDFETHYTVEITCRGVEEAHMRSLLLHGLSQSGLGLRRIDSEDIPDTSKVTVTAQAVATKRNDAALEQIVGRLRLEPHVTAATRQVDRAIPEA
jgi:putative Mg2+ transporter-C (MgtC) family protein